MNHPTVKVGLLGDSTIDNGYWVQRGIPYTQRTGTVTHQIAAHLADGDAPVNYEVANFSADGAMTYDITHDYYLNRVLGYGDEDHPHQLVNQLGAASIWDPEVVVLSVGGNNYRVAIIKELLKINRLKLLLRITPEEAKAAIKDSFEEIKKNLLSDYKEIINSIIKKNKNLRRIVLVSQYYPSVTGFPTYFIYQGFSHIARALGKINGPFEMLEENFNELYSDILKYASTLDKEIVVADVTSSLNPVNGNHTMQIEPNVKGSTLMGKVIAKAIEADYKKEETYIPIFRLDLNEETVSCVPYKKDASEPFKVRKINDFIKHSRYAHVRLLFSPSSTMTTRYEAAYHTVMGEQFDVEYTGLFAFGLLDLSLITIAAHYLWRVAVHEEWNKTLRITAAVVAAPILLLKLAVGLAFMALLAIPLFAYHMVSGLFEVQDVFDDESLDELEQVFA